LKQKQESEEFVITLPVAFYLEGADDVVWKNVTMNNKEQEFRFDFTKRPVKVEIDPEFNVFRKLNVKEVPPSLSQVQGSRNSKIILPKESNLYEAYHNLAKTWAETQKVQGKTIDIINDDELDHLPADVAFWILGSENKFSGIVSIPESYLNALSEDHITGIKNANQNGSLVYAIPNPDNEAITIAYIHGNSEAAINGLTRKLPHYGKYGYLGFEGDEPVNNLKGLFPAANSPLNYIIQYDGKSYEIKAKIVPRKALAEVQ
jgi:hypothetical protein